MRGSRKFCQAGSNSDMFFDEAKRIQIALKVAGHHNWPASGTPFKWRADDVPTLNAGLIAL